MKTVAVDQIDTKKQEIGSRCLRILLKSKNLQRRLQVTDTPPEETTDETDQEEIESAKVVITEGKDGKKRHFIEGVFLQGEIKNRNGRMYPAETFSVKLLNTTSHTSPKVAH